MKNILLILTKILTPFIKNISVGANSAVNILKLDIHNDGKVVIGNKTIVFGKLTCAIESSNIKIGDNCFIGNSAIDSALKITIGNNVLISSHCYITDHDSHSVHSSERSDDVRKYWLGQKDWTVVKKDPITINNGAWIGYSSIILKGVTVGENSIVSAGSVVTKDVPPNTIVGGNPARVIKEITE